MRRFSRRVSRLSILAIVCVMGLFGASALGVLGGAPSKFEAGDGDMVAANSGGTHDWNNVSLFHVGDPANTTGDDSFTSGQKQDTACPALSTNKNPRKDDFTDVASFNETNSETGSSSYFHTYLDGATIRYAANGNAAENVELNKGKNGLCANEPESLLARTPGDKLIAIDYLNGGTNVQFHVLTWIDGSDTSNPTCLVSNDTPPCWGGKVQSLSASAAEGQANQSAIASTANGINSQGLAVGQFAEFGVDLTAAGIIPQNTCEAFPQTVWESRSSGSSFVSSTEDVAIEHHTISNCGQIKIIKQTAPRGVNKTFAFSSNLPAGSSAGGVACAEGGSAGIGSGGAFCLNDSGNVGKTAGSTASADNSEGNTVEEKSVPANTYTVTEESEPSGFSFGGVTCSGGSTTTDNVKQQATITLKPSDEVVCTFVNNQQFGALKVTKVSTKSLATALAGAQFAIKDPSGKALAGSPYTTDGHGVVCIDGLSTLGSYSVQEVKAPAGYAIDNSTAEAVTVTGSNAKCGDESYTGQSLTFKDTPLTEVTITAKSEASGGTSSTVECTNSGTEGIGNSPKSGETATVTAKALKPGTYTCQVVVDP